MRPTASWPLLHTSSYCFLNIDLLACETEMLRGSAWLGFFCPISCISLCLVPTLYFPLYSSLTWRNWLGAAALIVPSAKWTNASSCLQGECALHCIWSCPRHSAALCQYLPYDGCSISTLRSRELRLRIFSWLNSICPFNQLILKLLIQRYHHHERYLSDKCNW